MELLDYQLRVFNFFKNPRNRHAFVVHGTGCGKTTLACCIAKEFLNQKIVESVQFVAPVSIHGQIEDNLNVLKVDTWNVAILSYNSFLHEVDSKGKLLIVDEAHNLRTPNGKMAKNCIKSCANATKVLIMTATPFVNDVNDLLNIVRMCFLIKIDSRVPLIHYLRDMNIFYKDRPVSEDYPTFEINKVYIVMTDEERISYEKFLHNQELESVDIDVHERIGKMGSNFMIHTNGMRRVGDSGVLPKLRYLEESIMNFDQQIIFSSWRKAGIDQITEILDKKKIQYGVITGLISKKKRTEYVKRYNTGDIKVLVFSKAGGEGIDLKGTRRVVILEPGWNIVLEQQAMNRAIRYKSHSHLPYENRHVLVEKFYIKNEISSDLILLKNYIERKEEQATKIMSLLEQLSL